GGLTGSLPCTAPTTTTVRVGWSTRRDHATISRPCTDVPIGSTIQSGGIGGGGMSDARRMPWLDPPALCSRGAVVGGHVTGDGGAGVGGRGGGAGGGVGAVGVGGVGVVVAMGVGVVGVVVGGVVGGVVGVVVGVVVVGVVVVVGTVVVGVVVVVVVGGVVAGA